MATTQSGEIQRAARGDSLLYRLGAMALELALLAAVWWILGLKLPLVGAVAAVIVVSNLVPERVGTLTLGVMLLALAGFVYWYYSAGRLALVIAIFGALAAGMGSLALRRGER